MLVVSVALIFVLGSDSNFPFLVLVLLSLGFALMGLLGKVKNKVSHQEITEKIKDVQAELEHMEQKREELLSKVVSGDLNTLPAFTDYTLQKSPITFSPRENDLQFRPQSGEVCFVQITDVKLGRVKSRTVTRKTGGGYRIGKVYVPVQKERVQEVNVSQIDEGTLAITNRRILYLGRERKLTVKFDKILEREAYQDALSITKDGRKSADLFLGVDGELLLSIIVGIESIEDE